MEFGSWRSLEIMMVSSGMDFNLLSWGMDFDLLEADRGGPRVLDLLPVGTWKAGVDLDSRRCRLVIRN